MEEDIKEILTALDNTTKKQLDEAIENADKEWSEMEMEEDIDKLQKLIDRCKECKFATCEQCEINWTEVQAIQNLIAKYKELEKHYQHEQEYINGEVFSVKQMHYIEDNYIDKLKVKEKLEELNFKLAEDVTGKLDATYNIRFTIQVLQELLED